MLCGGHARPPEDNADTVWDRLPLHTVGHESRGAAAASAAGAVMPLSSSSSLCTWELHCQLLSCPAWGTSDIVALKQHRARHAAGPGAGQGGAAPAGVRAQPAPAQPADTTPALEVRLLRLDVVSGCFAIWVGPWPSAPPPAQRACRLHRRPSTLSTSAAAAVAAAAAAAAFMQCRSPSTACLVAVQSSGHKPRCDPGTAHTHRSPPVVTLPNGEGCR